MVPNYSRSTQLFPVLDFGDEFFKKTEIANTLIDQDGNSGNFFKIQEKRAKLFKIIFSRILKKFPGFLSWTKMKMKKKPYHECGVDTF